MLRFNRDALRPALQCCRLRATPELIVGRLARQSLEVSIEGGRPRQVLLSRTWAEENLNQFFDHVRRSSRRTCDSQGRALLLCLLNSCEEIAFLTCPCSPHPLPAKLKTLLSGAPNDMCATVRIFLSGLGRCDGKMQSQSKSPYRVQHELSW